MRVVFLGSPPFAVPILQRLCAGRFRPSLVVTPPDRRRGRGRTTVRSELAELAASAEVAVLQPETVRDDATLERLREEQADVFLVASYGEFLPRAFVDMPALECLNVHPSLLPRHRGATPVQATLLAGDTRTGVSIQRVAMKIDAGDIVTALETEVRPGETAGELQARLAELGAEAALEALQAIDAGTAVFRPQDEAGVTLCTKLSKEDGLLDWSLDAEEITRRIHAMNPWPAARTVEPGGRDLTVLRARAHAGEPAVDGATPGALLDVDGRLLVAAGSGAVELLEVKPAGKRAMPAVDYLRGSRLECGALLGS